MNIRNHAGYLRKVFDRDDQTKVIRDIKSLIKQKNLQFDGFVVTGVSGIVLGSIIARSLNKDIVVVRKNNDGSHSSYKVENYKNDKSYIFLDDLIASGETYRHVKTAMTLSKSTKWLYGQGNPSKIIGTILFDPLKKDDVEYLSPQMVGKKLKRKLLN